jgi:hypothetical protein
MAFPVDQTDLDIRWLEVRIPLRLTGAFSPDLDKKATKSKRHQRFQGRALDLLVDVFNCRQRA